MNEVIERKYARLLLEVGVGLKVGQKLVVAAEPYHWDFLVLLTDEAYKMGASYVLVEATDSRMTEARVVHGAKENLGDVLGWVEKKNECLISEGWARLSFFGPTDPDLMGALDGGRLGLIQRAASISGKPVSEACGSGEMAWCVAALPTPKWAAKVFKEEATADNSADLVQSLWGEMVKILSLDDENPSAVWKKKGETLHARCAKLMKLNLRSVKFTGPGTDLTVGCFEDAKWIGGGIVRPDGSGFIPNLPTEECFTTPDMRATEGRAQVVRPVNVLGQSVEGAWFVFKEGKVVEYGAEKNKETLDRYFDMCPQAALLGELALVDGSSPIYQSGHVYECILYDENASCHVALGNGYAMAVPGGLEMSKEEKLENGVNVSLVHTDFMIGGPEVDVTGYDAEGKEFPLIRGGDFVLDGSLYNLLSK